MKDSNIIIFTDLDGTLLDSKYNFKFAKRIIRKLLARKVKIVFCSSKTRREVDYYREKFLVNGPFISENGAAIFLPKGYFKQKQTFTRHNSKYDIFELGLPYELIRKKLEQLRMICDCKVVGFGDMTVEAISQETELPFELARLAKEREYTEPFSFEDEKFLQLISKEGLCYVKGDRYFHLTGYHDKGKAVCILKKWFSEEFGSIKTFGVGNGLNDISMLNLVDYPFFIDRQEGLRLVWAEILSQINGLLEVEDFV